MTDTTISLRIDQETYKKMKQIEHINWSAIIRKALKEQLEKQFQNESTFDKERAKKAAKEMDKIRNSGIFNKEKSGTEIIREWRDKRKF